MNFLKYYNNKIIKHDLINKFKYDKVNKIPKIEKVVLNFGCKNFNIQKFATTFLALEIITSKKATLTTAKKANMLLKIQRGYPAGCKVILQGEEISKFLTRLFVEILPKLKNFSGFRIKVESESFSFKLFGNQILLQEFEEQYPLFASLPDLDINISTNSRTRTELQFLIKSLKFPIYKYKK